MPGSKWTDEEVETLRRLYAAGCNDAEIHIALPNRTTGAIERKRGLMGLRTDNGYTDWTPELDEVMAMLFRGGMDDDELARVLPVRSANAVCQRRLILGMRKPDRRKWMDEEDRQLALMVSNRCKTSYIAHKLHIDAGDVYARCLVLQVRAGKVPEEFADIINIKERQQ